MTANFLKIVPAWSPIDQGANDEKRTQTGKGKIWRKSPKDKEDDASIP